MVQNESVFQQQKVDFDLLHLLLKNTGSSVLTTSLLVVTLVLSLQTPQNRMFIIAWAVAILTSMKTTKSCNPTFHHFPAPTSSPPDSPSHNARQTPWQSPAWYSRLPSRLMPCLNFVAARFPAIISAIRACDTPISFARRYWVMP